MPPPARSLVLCAVLPVLVTGLAVCTAGIPPALDAQIAASPEAGPEVVRYRWRLQGFRGAIVGFFLPNQGEGSLTTTRNGAGHLESELLITSAKRGDGEFWRYGAELDPISRTTVRAWSSYFFRGEKKSREERLDGQNVMDVASGIYLLRQNPPTRPRPMRIWSDGKIYSVVATPLGIEQRGPGRASRRARHISILPSARPGERPWKGRMELWLADDAAATPVEILIERSWAGVRLEMVPPAPSRRAP